MPVKSVGKLAVLGAVVLVTGCGGSSDSKDGPDLAGDSSKGKLALVAYSTPEVVYNEIIPAFQKTPAGDGIGFEPSYGASGDQSRAVEAGQDADYVSFSVAPDMDRLVDADLVDAGWTQTPTDGLITTSVVSFIVRKGNPKDIRTWDDLLEPGVEVLAPNPFTSGAAKWNLLGAYGSGGGGDEDPEAGLAYVKELLDDHVVAQDKSGRDALQNFLSGTGDVLLSYEYEAITAKKQGEQDIEYVVPDDSVKIDITAAVTKDAPEAAQSFLDFALGEEGQRLFADWGYRPVNETVLEANADKFPAPENLLTIEDFGGWDTVNEELFDLETGGAIAKLVEATGVPTSD